MQSLLPTIYIYLQVQVSNYPYFFLFNSVCMMYIIISIFQQFKFQKNQQLNNNHYLHMKFSKSLLLKFLILRDILTVFVEGVHSFCSSFHNNSQNPPGYTDVFLTMFSHHVGKYSTNWWYVQSHSCSNQLIQTACILITTPVPISSFFYKFHPFY